MEDPSLQPPREFTCPLSSLLMADPVIVSTGHTFERACILACVDLGFNPSLLSPYLDLSAISKPSSLPLFPNINLKSAILNWCSETGFPKPVPITQEAAREIVRGLIAREKTASVKSQPSSTSVQDNQPSSSLSKQISLEVVPEGTPVVTQDGSLEDKFLVRLIDTEPGEQVATLVSLREATRDNRERRRSLCTSRMLGVLRRLLLSRSAGVQINAAAALVNLSLEPSNKINLVRAEVVPPLVELLTHGSSELRDHAAGAIYSLAVEEKNRVAIGVLGAIPPLLKLFATTSEGVRARRDAGMGLYYLTLEELNKSKLTRVPGVARTLLEMVTEQDVRRPALMVSENLAECQEGREVLIDCGAVEVLVRLMRDGVVAPGSVEEENCLKALRWMSRASMRFRGMARAAGAEAVLRQVEESTVDGHGPRKEYASGTLRSIAGEEEDGSSSSMFDGSDVVMISLSNTSPFREIYNNYHKLAKLKSAQF
ncbi:U-box domain-containing protein 40 [Rhynchospora pubera]|uniref:RING-type E3 ubiquitin transferase n=1 Tax=Rhynchospora pubera TaxID=906938 RepID=A0AAV8CR54_9POAL|nr:U-box domain-containing protein 40 [Rhynchospora pubera]